MSPTRRPTIARPCCGSPSARSRSRSRSLSSAMARRRCAHPALREVVRKLQRDACVSFTCCARRCREIVREPLATDRRDLWAVRHHRRRARLHRRADDAARRARLRRRWHDGARRAPRHDHPAARAAALIFVGDLVDRGPRSPDVLRIVMSDGGGRQAFCVPGNHDAKFMRWLEGPQRQADARARSHGRADGGRAEARSIRRAVVPRRAAEPHLGRRRPPRRRARRRDATDMIGTSIRAVREFCLYGDTDGATDADGLPVRYHWAADYRGETTIVYGHTPVADATWLNNTLCIDTGCCFGGKLTALRWPEREIVSVPRAAAYAERRAPVRPSAAAANRDRMTSNREGPPPHA